MSVPYGEWGIMGARILPPIFEPVSGLMSAKNQGRYFLRFQFFFDVFLWPFITDRGMTPPSIVILKPLINRLLELFQSLGLVDQGFRLHLHAAP